MFEIISHYLVFLLIIYSNGILLQKSLIANKVISFNFFEHSIIGLIFTGFIAVILNFFFPLNDIFIYLNLLLSFFFLFFFKNEIKFNYNNKIQNFIILIFILSLANLYGSGFSDDLNHYHGGYINNSDNHKYIIGSNFLHHHFGYSSIWLTLHSYLNINDTFLQDIHIINALIFFLIISYFLTESLNYKKNSKNNFLYILSSLFIFFFLIKYTRLKEFGLDRPGILLFCFLLYFASKYEKLLKFSNNDKNIYFIILFITSLFVTSIKIFFLSSFLIPLFFIFKLKYYEFFYSKIAFILYFLCSAFFLKNILITGCAIYPFDFTCFTNLPWNSKEIATNLFLTTEASTKSIDQYKGLLSTGEYIKNFNWFATWFERNLEEFTNYFVTLIIIIFIFFISSRSKLKKNGFSNLEKIIFLLFIFNVIIFFKSPVIRYHHILFILFGLILITMFKRDYFKKVLIFNMIIIFCFSFNFLKNLKRIYDTNFYNNPYEHIKKIDWYRVPQLKNINNFNYYMGWIDAHPVGNMNLKNFKHKKKYGFDIIYKK